MKYWETNKCPECGGYSFGGRKCYSCSSKSANLFKDILKPKEPDYLKIDLNKCPECGGYSFGGRKCYSCSSKSTNLFKDILKPKEPDYLKIDLNKCPECGGYSFGGGKCDSCLSKSTDFLKDMLNPKEPDYLKIGLYKCPECGGYSFGGIKCDSCSSKSSNLFKYILKPKEPDYLKFGFNKCPECGGYSFGGGKCDSCSSKSTNFLKDILKPKEPDYLKFGFNKCPECGGYSFGGGKCDSCSSKSSNLFKDILKPKEPDYLKFGFNKCPECGGYSFGGGKCFSCLSKSLSTYPKEQLITPRISPAKGQIKLPNTCVLCSQYSPVSEICEECLVKVLTKYMEQDIRPSSLAEIIPSIPMVQMQAIPSPIIIPVGSTVPMEVVVVNNSPTALSVKVNCENGDNAIKIKSMKNLVTLKPMCNQSTSFTIVGEKTCRRNVKIRCKKIKDRKNTILCSQNVTFIVTNSLDSTINHIFKVIDDMMLQIWGIKKPDIEIVIDTIKNLKEKGYIPQNKEGTTQNTKLNFDAFCTPTHVIIPLENAPHNTIKDIIGYCARSYVHEVFGHGFLFKNTRFGRFLDFLWNDKCTFREVNAEYLLAKDCCISTMEGFAVWLFMQSVKYLQKILPVFNNELYRQQNLLEFQLHPGYDPTNRMRKSDIYTKEPWCFNFSASIQPEAINPYYYGISWFNRIAYLFGSTSIPCLAREIMDVKNSPKLSNIEVIVGEKFNKPDYWLFKLAFIDQFREQRELVKCHNNASRSVKLLKKMKKELRKISSF